MGGACRPAEPGVDGAVAARSLQLGQTEVKRFSWIRSDGVRGDLVTGKGPMIDLVDLPTRIPIPRMTAGSVPTIARHVRRPRRSVHARQNREGNF